MLDGVIKNTRDSFLTSDLGKKLEQNVSSGMETAVQKGTADLISVLSSSLATITALLVFLVLSTVVTNVSLYENDNTNKTMMKKYVLVALIIFVVSFYYTKKSITSSFN